MKVNTDCEIRTYYASLLTDQEESDGETHEKEKEEKRYLEEENNTSAKSKLFQ